MSGHRRRAEENVDQVVAGDAIQAVVPLLTFYADVDGEGPTYQCARALAGGIHARGRSCLGSHSDVCCLLLLLQSHRSASSARWYAAARKAASAAGAFPQAR